MVVCQKGAAQLQAYHSHGRGVPRPQGALERGDGVEKEQKLGLGRWTHGEPHGEELVVPG